MTFASKKRRLNKLPREYRQEVDLQLKEIAEKIRRSRESQKISQEALAELSNVAPTTIQGIESNRTRPSLELLIGLAKILKIKITLN